MRMITLIMLMLASSVAFAGGQSKSSELHVGSGFFSKTQNPGCIGDYSSDPSARCEQICVTLMRNQRVTQVRYFLRTGNEAYVEVRPDEIYKKAKFSSEPTINNYVDSIEVCSTVKNWNTRIDVFAKLEVEFN